ncbi:MAG: DUF3455 domain-containing protein [Polyangiales bacterium]
MKPLTLSLRAALVTAFGLALGACAVDTGDADQAAQAVRADPCPSPMPSGAVAGTSLTPAADQTLAFVFHAVGTQNYVCNAAGTGWTFVGPRADLLDDHHHVVGTHFASAAGPTRPEWRFRDGSAVIMARASGVTVSSTAVPWLLLNAVSYEGAGRFSEITSIQRLSTVGGVAPSAPCTAGASSSVPYEADYFFYRTNDDDDRSRQCRSAP